MWEINEEMQKSCFWGIFLNCGEKKKIFESDVNDGSRQKGNCWGESNYRIQTLDPFVHVFNIGINNSEITLWAICGLRCAIKGKQDTDRGYLEKVYLTSPLINKKLFNICCRVRGIVSVIKNYTNTGKWYALYLVTSFYKLLYWTKHDHMIFFAASEEN